MALPLKKITPLLLFLIPVSLSAQKKLHEKSIVIDTHNDVLSSATLKGLNIEDDLSGKTHSDLERFRKGGIDIQIFSIFGDERYVNGTAYKHAIREIDSLDAITARNPGRMMLVNNMNDLRTAIQSGKLGAMKGVEGGHMIEDRLDYLDSLYFRGVRYMTLTWNNSTSWASSAWDETKLDAGKTVPITKKGLNDFGRQGIESAPRDLDGVEDMPHLTTALRKRGYSKKDIRKILGENFIRIFSEAGN